VEGGKSWFHYKDCSAVPLEFLAMRVARAQDQTESFERSFEKSPKLKSKPVVARGPVVDPINWKACFFSYCGCKPHVDKDAPPRINSV
jgi:hypothetical protein